MPGGSSISAKIYLERWLGDVVPGLSASLQKLDLKEAENSTKNVSYIFQFCSVLIFRHPDKGEFNSSPFVRLCKLYLQGIVGFFNSLVALRCYVILLILLVNDLFRCFSSHFCNLFDIFTSLSNRFSVCFLVSLIYLSFFSFEFKLIS